MTTSPTPEFRHSLPPSARDYLAYHRIAIEMASTRQTAAELKISQTRVRQIVHRVADWMTDHLPATSETRQSAQIRLAQHVAAERLHRYFCEVDHAWRQTKETKYLTAILRILTAQTKLPAHPFSLEALFTDAVPDSVETSAASTPESCAYEDHANEDLASEGWDSEPPPTATQPSQARSEFSTPHSAPTATSSLSIQSSASSTSPPSEDCSPSPNQRTIIAAHGQPLPTRNPSAPTSSASPRSRHQAARRAFLDPAQPLEIQDDQPITELKVTPQKFGLQTINPLSRRDRRRLKRLAHK